MKSLFAQYATNRKHEAEGIWVEVQAATEHQKATRFRVARRGRTNKRYRAMLDAEIKPFSVQLRNETLDPETDEQITRKVFCSTILLGWSGVYAPEIFGTEDEIEFTVDNAIKLMKALPDLYDMLVEQASKASNFRDAEREDEAKN